MANLVFLQLFSEVWILRVIVAYEDIVLSSYEWWLYLFHIDLQCPL